MWKPKSWVVATSPKSFKHLTAIMDMQKKDYETRRKFRKEGKEYGKRCGKCWKYRECRRFYRKIKGKYILLCQECWEGK